MFLLFTLMTLQTFFWRHTEQWKITWTRSTLKFFHDHHLCGVTEGVLICCFMMKILLLKYFMSLKCRPAEEGKSWEVVSKLLTGGVRATASLHAYRPGVNCCCLVPPSGGGPVPRLLVTQLRKITAKTRICTSPVFVWCGSLHQSWEFPACTCFYRPNVLSCFPKLCCHCVEITTGLCIH